MTLSFVGLFGLAAFMVEKRSREIGIRKVMGANVRQITQLVIWQFSMPVVWSLLAAIPASYFASKMYLNFFSDRLSTPIIFIIMAGVIAILSAWAIVSIHAVRIARSNPIKILRHE